MATVDKSACVVPVILQYSKHKSAGLRTVGSSARPAQPCAEASSLSKLASWPMPTDISVQGAFSVARYALMLHRVCAPHSLPYVASSHQGCWWCLWPFKTRACTYFRRVSMSGFSPLACVGLSLSSVPSKAEACAAQEQVVSCIVQGTTNSHLPVC